MIPVAHVPDEHRWVFPELRKDEVFANVRQRWDTSGTVPLPRRGWLTCGACGAYEHEQLLRLWKFHQYNSSDDHTTPYRCDVAFKCTRCSYTYVFGVATPKRMNEFWGLHTTVTYREALNGFVPPE